MKWIGFSEADLKKAMNESTAHNWGFGSEPDLTLNTIGTIPLGHFLYVCCLIPSLYYMPYCATHTRIAIRLARGGDDDAAPPPPQATSTSLQSLHSTKAACALQILSSLNTNRNVRQSKSSSQSYPPW